MKRLPLGLPKRNSIRFLAIFKPTMANKKELNRVSQSPTPASLDPLNKADRKTISLGNNPPTNQDNNLDPVNPVKSPGSLSPSNRPKVKDSSPGNLLAEKQADRGSNRDSLDNQSPNNPIVAEGSNPDRVQVATNRDKANNPAPKEADLPLVAVVAAMAVVTSLLP